MMTTEQVAKRLVELCRQGKFSEAQDELYAPDVESIEPAYSPTPYAKGMDAIKEKDRQFHEATETMHSAFTSDPLVAGNFFTLTMGMDITMKGQERMTMEEVCLYEVKDGKVVKEQFFF